MAENSLWGKVLAWIFFTFLAFSFSALLGDGDFQV